jgi:hypothetical protein
MVDPKAHQLYKQLPGSLFMNSGSPGSSAASNGWEILEESGVVYFINRTYIDLQGWSAQDLTTFTQGVDIQKGIMPLLGGGEAAKGLREFDFITTRKLSDSELILFNNIPGYLPSTVDLMDMIYGEFVEYGRNTTITNTFIKTNFETLGSGNPTAMSRMHWTRVYYFHVPDAGDTLLVDATNLVVQALTVEEKDLIWMERLRRSYVHQDRADI